MPCIPSVPLLRVPWAHHNEFFECSKGCVTDYALLMMITIVPWVQLRTWHGSLSSDGAPGKPIFPQNVHWWLEGYLCPCYEPLTSAAEEEITTAIEKILCM